MSNFKTILIAIFVGFFIFAVMIFSGIIKIGSDTPANTPQGKIVVWGTFDGPDIQKTLETAISDNKNLTISYVYKPRDAYAQDLIEAFANGSGPDLFIMTPDMINKFEKFALKIPYASYPRKLFSDSYIDGADIYMASDGIIAFPLAVDPMVMYYNKDILSNAGISQPPQFWNELFDFSSRLTTKKDDGTILQSMIGLGRYDNVTNAKDILATLLIQNNNNIIKRNDSGSIFNYTPVLNDNSVSVAGVSLVETILNYFIEFSNPADSAYSWNRSLPSSQDLFTGGKEALYLGRASELFKIQSINPNLSFDVTQILQTQGVSTKRTEGDIYAIAINKQSTNTTAASSVAGLMSSGDNEKNLAINLSLPPALRTLLSDKPTDPYMFTFFNSAIITRSWLDPNSAGSDAIFAELIQNILSNKLSVSDAISKAQSEFEQIVNQ